MTNKIPFIIFGALILVVSAVLGGIYLIDGVENTATDTPPEVDSGRHGTDITNASAVSQYHEEVASTELQNYKITHTETRVVQNGSPETVKRVYKYAQGSNNTQALLTVDTPQVTRMAYAEDADEYAYHLFKSSSQDPSYQRRPLDGTFLGDAGYQYLQPKLSQVTYEFVENQTRDGQTVSHYRITGVVPDSQFDKSNISADGNLSISENGLIVTATINTTSPDSEATSTTEFTLSGVGTTTVNRPDWYDTARKETDNSE